MRICFIDFGFYTPENVLTPLYEYSQILSKRGFCVTVFVRHHKDNIPNSANIEIRTVCGEFFVRKITHVIFLIKLITILRREQFDIIQVFNFPGVFLLPVFCRKRNQKWILDIQSVTKEAGLKGFLYDSLSVLEAGSFDVINLLNHRMKNKLFGDRLREKIRIVPLGINLKRFEKAKCDRTIWRDCGISDNDTILIYVGKLDKYRRLDNVLDAFRIAVEHIENKNVKLVFIGGENSEIERLTTKAENNHIADKVLFFGPVPYEKIPSFLRSSDVGIAYIPKTSSYDVQPPLKTLEYLAASLPVLATNTEANLDILEDDVNGVIAKDNPEDFAQGIIKILENAHLRSYIKSNAFNSIIGYDWEKIVEYLLKIYQS